MNPGFDATLSGWGGISSSGEPNWASDDADNCPESGSVHGIFTTQNTNFGPGQCIQVSAGKTYYYGALFKSASDLQTMGIVYYSDLACKTYVSAGPYIQISSTPVDWSPLAGAVTPPASVRSLLLYAGIVDGDMDQAYFNAVASSY